MCKCSHGYALNILLSVLAQVRREILALRIAIRGYHGEPNLSKNEFVLLCIDDRVEDYRTYLFENTGCY